MSKKQASPILSVTLAMLSVILAGVAHAWASSPPPIQVKYIGQVNATAVLKPAAILDTKVLLADGWLVIASGSFTCSGRITPTKPGSVLPSKLRFQVVHKNASGKVLYQLKFDVSVQSNGTIPRQVKKYTAFDQIPPGDTLETSFLPVDRPLPAGTINLVSSIGGSSYSKARPFRQASPEVVVQQVELDFNWWLYGAAKGQSFWHCLLSSPKGQLFTITGSFYLKGKLTPDKPGTPLPSKLKMVIKHLSPTGTLIKTDNFPFTVQSDGTIPYKSYPYTTVNPSGVNESLDISLITVDKAFPDQTTAVLVIGAKAASTAPAER
ncbi:MAG: hypothetical protein AB1714_23585 [Acidobacteriota bacterium]